MRFIPPGGALVEVTCRTIHGRFLLRPSPELRDVVLGVLGRAQRLYPVEVCGLVFLSNHFHLLLVVPDAQRLASFMCFVNSNLAREVGRMAKWRDKFWARRYQAIVVSQEEGAQVGRLKYLLSHGCKEGLVARPHDWPGVHGIHALLEGEPLVGHWFDRTQEYAARSLRECYAPLRYATPEALTLAPLPCWKHLPLSDIRQRIRDLLSEVEAEAVVQREGAAPLGVEGIRRQNAHDVPALPTRSPAPSFHAISRAARRELQDAYAWFVGVFRDAAASLRKGDRSATFPCGSFPPALPFVESAQPP
ncbi:MAG TPA: transposase [Thermoanaerobaculia bacterium]|nr:transposase [Thermoanaerobaculia bacterium]